MGITHKSLERLRQHNLLSSKSMLELGAQNLYNAENYGEVAKAYFERLGIKHTSWDITPHQGAVGVDLRHVVPVFEQYDVVTDFGTSEHVDSDFYNVHFNIHNHCKQGGYIVHENPKTGHWPGHGRNYVNTTFYLLLAEAAGYDIVEIGEEYAMGNVTDGGNVVCVMKKTTDVPFISLETFNNIGNVFSK